MSERMLIQISFKREEKDLYERVNAKGDKSNYIKEAIKIYEGYINTKRMTKPLFGITEMDDEY